MFYINSKIYFLIIQICKYIEKVYYGKHIARNLIFLQINFSLDNYYKHVLVLTKYCLPPDFRKIVYLMFANYKILISTSNI